MELPESAITPRRKGPWKRRPGSLLSSPASATPSPLSLRKSRARVGSDAREWQSERCSSDTESKDEKEDGWSDGRDAKDAEMEAQPESVTENDDNDGLAISHSNLQADEQTPETSPIATSREKPAPALQLQAIGDPLDSPSDKADAHIESSTEAPLLSEILESDIATPALLDSKDADTTERESGDGPCDDFGQISEKSVGSSSSKEDHAIALDQSTDLSDAVSRHTNEHRAERESDGAEFTVDLNNSVVRGVLDNGEETEDDENGSSSGHLPADPGENVDLAHSADELSANETSKELKIDCVEENEPPRVLSQTLSNSSDAVSVSSHADSFHSLASLENESSDVEADLAEFSDPTPLAETNDPLTPPPRHHRRDVSEMTVTIDTNSILPTTLPISPLLPSTAASEGPSTPSLLRSSASDSSWPEIETPTAVSGDDGLRQRSKTKRSFSPLTPSFETFASSSQSPRGNHLTGAILQTARHLALIKPVDVVFMLVHIFARIAGGATVKDLMNGDLFRRPVEPLTQRRRRRSLPDPADCREGNVLEEDDYGVPIRGRSSTAAPIVQKDDDADSLFDLD